MKTIRKIFMAVMIGVVGFGALAACGGTGNIQVINRESGSGTRGAFYELVGIQYKDDAGKTQEHKVVAGAIEQNATGKVLTSVAGDKNAIGYISLGSLNDTVKAISVDGIAATVANVKNDTYKMYRPFNLVRSTKSTAESYANKAAVDAFYTFFDSKDAQDIIAKDFISDDTKTTPYSAVTGLTGTVTISGSTSIKPLMEKLTTKFKELQPSVVIEWGNLSGSGAGISDADEGKADIGMKSAKLSDSDKTKFTEGQRYQLALDGIAVIVHKNNTISNISKADLLKIYKGEIVKFDELTQA